MTNRLDQKFSELKSEGKKGFFPFIVAGQVSMDFTIELITALQEAGVSGIELGIPFSDPIADGPVIQTAFSKALKSGITTKLIFNTLKGAKERIKIPITAMVSASIVYRIGPTKFIEMAKSAGIDGLIIPDLPLEEAAEIKKETLKEDMRLAMLVAPTTPEERMARIASTATGFIYYISVTGITGERDRLPEDLPARVARLKELSSGLPVLVGFGINRPEQVRMVCSVADGAIVGSAIVRRILEAEEKKSKPEEIIRLITDYTKQLLSGIA